MAAYIYANSLSASGRRCWSRRARGFPGNTVHKTALLTNAALSDIICKMKLKWHPKFSENSWFPSEIHWYKNTRTGFRFWNVQCSTKRPPPPPPIIQISVSRFKICDVTNTGKQLCSPNEPFVVVPKHTHYTLTKIQKVKKHNRTPLTLFTFFTVNFCQPQLAFFHMFNRIYCCAKKLSHVNAFLWNIFKTSNKEQGWLFIWKISVYLLSFPLCGIMECEFGNLRWHHRQSK